LSVSLDNWKNIRDYSSKSYGLFGNMNNKDDDDLVNQITGDIANSEILNSGDSSLVFPYADSCKKTYFHFKS
jgi:hypothetical protein